jgi:hypothetical protein
MHFNRNILGADRQEYLEQGILGADTQHIPPPS